MGAGILAGFASKVAEYPFDTLKVLYQSGNVESQPKSAVSHFAQIVREEGVARIFRGLPAPLAGACLENLIVFWLYGFAERQLKARRALLEEQVFFPASSSGGDRNSLENSQTERNGTKSAQPLSLFEVSLAGAFSGIGTGLWLGPVELIKTKMQTAPSGTYSSTFDCLSKTVRANPLALSVGLGATLLRDVPGATMYFVGYKSTCRALTALIGFDDMDGTKDPPPWIVMCGGAGAGLAFWLSIFPFDMAKTQQQSASSMLGLVSGETAQVSIWKILKFRYDRYGLRGWYAGLGVTVPRAIISNSIIFAVYEYSRNFFDCIFPDGGTAKHLAVDE
jgi:hypothetical protein